MPRKRKAARQRKAIEPARPSLWHRLVVTPAFSAPLIALMAFIPAVIRGTNAATWQELLDRFTIGFIFIWVLMAFLSMLALASAKKWLRRRR